MKKVQHENSATRKMFRDRERAKFVKKNAK